MKHVSQVSCSETLFLTETTSLDRLSLKQRKLLDQPGQEPLKLTGPTDFLLAQKIDNDRVL